VAQHRNRVRARPLVCVRIESSPQDRPDAQPGEEIGRHQCRLGTLGSRPRIQFDCHTGIERDEAGESVAASLVVQVLRIAERHPDSTVLGPFADIEHAIRLGHREWPEKQPIRPGEERGCRAEAERQRQNNRRREARLSPEPTCRVSHVPPAITRPLTGRDAGCRGRRLQRLPQRRQVLRQRAVPQQCQRETRRLFLRRAIGDQFPPAIVEMLGEFVDDLVLTSWRQAQRRQAWADVRSPVRHLLLA
jgi:hypothetical protein